jgi:hypothetical protein
MGAIRRDWDFQSLEREGDNVTAILYRIYNMAIDHLSGTLVSSLERERESPSVHQPGPRRKVAGRVSSIIADERSTIHSTSNSISSLYYLFSGSVWCVCGGGGEQVREKQIKMGSPATANDFFFSQLKGRRRKHFQEISNII